MGKQNGDTEWRIYYTDDTVRFIFCLSQNYFYRLSSPRVQILHIRSGWRFTVSVIMMFSAPYR